MFFQCLFMFATNPYIVHIPQSIQEQNHKSTLMIKGVSSLLLQMTLVVNEGVDTGAKLSQEQAR